MRLNQCLLMLAALCAACCGNATGAIALDESPAEPEAWGFRPDTAYPPELNPPSFTWRPVKDAAAYRIEVAADAAFQQVIHEAACPWPAYCPPEPLTPGAYFWRYAAQDTAETLSGWSVARPFTITPELPEYPKPARAAIAARIPQAHPRLFLRPDEIAHFQELIAGPLADTWAALRKEADKHLQNPPDTSEPPLYPEGTERKGEEWRKIWWGNRTRSVAVGEAAATLALVYRLSGERRYGEAARDLVMAVAKWDPAGSTNFRYNDEAAMPLLYLPARAYTWAQDCFTPEQRSRLAEQMAARGADCYNHLIAARHLWRPYNSHSNRSWHKLGELSLAFYGEIPQAEEWLDFALTVFYTCYPVWGGADGGWHEGVSYWSSYMSRFLHWAFASQPILGIDPFEKPFFRETGYYGLYTLPPGAKAGAFGDLAAQADSTRIARLMRQLAAGARNPHWQWYADAHKAVIGGYHGLICAVRLHDVASKKPEALPSSRAFGGVGLAVMNSNLFDGADNIQAHFKSSPYGRQSHGYNSNNSFLLNINGQCALIASGRRDIHGSPHHTKWMWESKSDNSILVNGEGQIAHSAASKGRIAFFHTSPALDCVVGEAGESYTNLERWTRRIFFFKPHGLLIHDVLEAPQPSNYQWLLHAPAPAFTLGENAASWAGAPGRVDVRFLHPENLRLSQSGAFDTPPHDWASFKLDEWHLRAETAENTAEQQFVTWLQVNEAQADVAISTEGAQHTVRLQLPERTITVSLTPDHFRVEGDGISLAH